MKPLLNKTNDLSRLDSGVWVAADESARSCIDYSDGEAKEAEVRRVVEQAQDTSADSPELDRGWQEWALEYHLTSVRSNLLRGCDFAGIGKVLEVGCGCGAITRYLGEQGLQVDAIEGSMQRAEIARLRCRDLDNVNIVCSNYNELQLSAEEYDLILFIGVLEYSGAYGTGGAPPEAQLVATLAAALEALAPAGTLAIAIENRIGFKYLAGAREDHLAMPHIGVRGYPEYPAVEVSRTRGIRTYDKQQWQVLLEQAGVGHAQFYYPFPDYKLPTVLVSDRFATGNRYAFSPLHGAGSRDYLGRWYPDIDESMFWKAAAEGKFLDQAANSFLIFAGRSSEPTRTLLPFDFVRYSSRRRKPEYRLQIAKLADQSLVVSRRRNPGTPAPTDPAAVVEHRVLDAAYVEGELLSERWETMLKTYGEFGVWVSLLKEYRAYLDDLFATSGNPRQLLDALPSNIVVDAASNEWRLIDLEWEAQEEISADFVFFRALLQFVLWHRDVLQFARSVEGVQLIGDLVAQGFEVTEGDLAPKLERFMALEDRFQRQVTRQGYLVPVQELLRHRLYEIDEEQEPKNVRERLSIPFEPYTVTAYWAHREDLCFVEHSVSIVPTTAAEGEVAEFEVPVEAGQHRILRIDPANHLLAACNGLFQFVGVSLEVIEADGQRRTALQIDTLDQLLEQAVMVDLERVQDARGELLLVESFDPRIVFDLGENWALEAQSIRLRFTIKWPYGSDYMRMRKLLSSEDELLARRVWEKRKAFNGLGEESARLGEELASLRQEIQELEECRAALAPLLKPISRLMRFFRK